MGDSPHDDTSEPLAARPLSRGAKAGNDPARPGRAGGDRLFVGMGAICDTAARLTGVDGAAVAVLVASQGVRELVYATDALAQQIDELQFTVGEGPCLDAYHADRPQLCAQLDTEGLQRRWPAFTAEVAGLGVAAVFAYPVPGQHGPMGVLELYRRTEGDLRGHEQQSAKLCASALRTTLEANWVEHVMRSTTEEAAIEAAALSGSAPAPSNPFTRSQVYVAAGMVAVQLTVSTTVALDRLRAYAYAHTRSITAVAADVVARRLSFRHLDDDATGVES
jgi:GAF domain